MDSHIRQVDELGNTQGREGQVLASGEMVRDQAVPEGCTPYHNPASVPLYGSNVSNGEEQVKEKKLEHKDKKGFFNFLKGNSVK